MNILYEKATLKADQKSREPLDGENLRGHIRGFQLINENENARIVSREEFDPRTVIEKAQR